MLWFILILALLFAAIFLIRKFFSKNIAAEEGSQKQLKAKMVKCIHCGVYVPEETAIKALGKTYCSEAHRLDDTDKGQQ